MNNNQVCCWKINKASKGLCSVFASKSLMLLYTWSHGLLTINLWILTKYSHSRASQVELSGKESACQCRRYRGLRFDPWVRKIPWSKKWQPTLVFLPGKCHEQRSLVGDCPWSLKGSDTDKWLSMHILLILKMRNMSSEDRSGLPNISELLATEVWFPTRLSDAKIQLSSTQ